MEHFDWSLQGMGIKVRASLGLEIRVCNEEYEMDSTIADSEVE